MRCHHGIASRTALALRLLAVASSAVVLTCAGPPLAAGAAADRPRLERADRGHDTDRDDDKGGHRSHDGNGTGNRNIFSVKSPTTNKGYQHTSASTVSGTSSIQNALCRYAKVCKITLNVIMIYPKKPATTKTTTTEKPHKATQHVADLSDEDCECDCEDSCE